MITDARHDSTANAYHTTVPCLYGRLELQQKCVFIFILLVHISIFSTKRILGISTLSREDHSIAQTRELERTKVVLPDCPTSPEAKLPLQSYVVRELGGGGGVQLHNTKIILHFIKCHPIYPGIHKDPWRSDLGLPMILQWLLW